MGVLTLQGDLTLVLFQTDHRWAQKFFVNDTEFTASCDTFDMILWTCRAFYRKPIDSLTDDTDALLNESPAKSMKLGCLFGNHFFHDITEMHAHSEKHIRVQLPVISVIVLAEWDAACYCDTRERTLSLQKHIHRRSSSRRYG